MVINLKLSDHTLKFTLKGHKTRSGLPADRHGLPADRHGEGIERLLTLIEANKEPIAAVNLEGQSSSYTFSRQVYLVVNLLRRLSGCSKKVVLPFYRP